MGADQIAKIIEQAGLIGILALSLAAIAWLTKKVFAQQKTIQEGLAGQVEQSDKRNEQLKEQNKELMTMLEDSTKASVSQTNSNGDVVKKLEELARESASRGPQLQALEETVKRILREANIAQD